MVDILEEKEVTYKDHIITAMNECAANPRTVFVGYNVAIGRFGGTLNNVPESQLQEMPLAENLMVGAAIGLSLEGLIPIVAFERMDFLTCAMDAIVNHMDKLAQISDGQHKPGVILRVVVGNKNVPLFSGSTHTQNLSEGMRNMVGFPVKELRWKTEIAPAYEEAMRSAEHGFSTMLVEFKDLHES